MTATIEAVPSSCRSSSAELDHLNVLYADDERVVLVSTRRTKVYVHVNKHRMTYNRNHEHKLPVVAVRFGRSGTPLYCNRCAVKGTDVEVIYSPEHALCSGAEVWMEFPIGTQLTLYGIENSAKLKEQYNGQRIYDDNDQ